MKKEKRDTLWRTSPGGEQRNAETVKKKKREGFNVLRSPTEAARMLCSMRSVLRSSTTKTELLSDTVLVDTATTRAHLYKVITFFFFFCMHMQVLQNAVGPEQIVFTQCEKREYKSSATVIEFLGS